jgi:hypothetical protein
VGDSHFAAAQIAIIRGARRAAGAGSHLSGEGSGQMTFFTNLIELMNTMFGVMGDFLDIIDTVSD